ncbi:MAG: PA3496 family putative envelope integrity protein [Gammaproteobacteria bacterium]
MARTSAKLANKPAEAMGPIDHEDDEIFDEAEFSSLNSGDADTIKRDARRKIEIYWEKKRLREQFDDLDEAELGF